MSGLANFASVNASSGAGYDTWMLTRSGTTPKTLNGSVSGPIMLLT